MKGKNENILALSELMQLAIVQHYSSVSQVARQPFFPQLYPAKGSYNLLG